MRKKNKQRPACILFHIYTMCHTIDMPLTPKPFFFAIKHSVRTPHPLHSHRLRATVASHPWGNISQVTAPPPPDYYAKDLRCEAKHADTRAHEPQNDPETASWDANSALLSDALCVPLFLVRVFDSEELHMLNRGHWNGVSSCRLGCPLGCRLGAAALVEGLASGMRHLSPYPTRILCPHNLSV